MKATWKVLAVLLICALVLCSIAYVVNPRKVMAMLNITERRYSVDDEKSQLLSLLILPEDLKDEFRWYYVLISENSTPPAEATDVVDGASSTLGGFHDGKEVGIIAQFKEYNSRDANELLKASYFSSRFALAPTKELSDLRLVKVSSIQRYACAYSVTDETQCLVGIIISDKVVFLDVRVYAVLDRSSTEEVLNLLLNVLKKKLV